MKIHKNLNPHYYSVGAIMILPVPNLADNSLMGYSLMNGKKQVGFHKDPLDAEREAKKYLERMKHENH